MIALTTTIAHATTIEDFSKQEFGDFSPDATKRAYKMFRIKWLCRDMMKKNCSADGRLFEFPATQAAASMTAPWDPRPEMWGDGQAAAGTTVLPAQSSSHPCEHLLDNKEVQGETTATGD